MGSPFLSKACDHWSCGFVDGPCDRAHFEHFIVDPAHGAISIFQGVVRNHNDGIQAAAVDYDVHPELALNSLVELCAELTDKYPVKLRIIHSRGLVKVGMVSVIIGASSAHRKEAIDAVSEAIDLLKIRVPIWKREISPDESYRWLDGNSLRQE